ncbi:MAG: SDR family NAD(P)-dependent oxidoreductase, partial [Burkholderiales bacterium]|nr:SDR family NAD(P)-dependent oxidoreductase [Burkholderiales bacterium]
MEKVLSGKVAIVTGANQGLGLQIAHRYLAAGADLMLCARNAALLDQARSELLAGASPGQKILAQIADVSVESDVQNVVKQALDQLNGCHILVNNAGVYGPKG